MDVQKIMQSMSSKHSDFLKSAGQAPYKISADHCLLVTHVSSKIRLIVDMLVEKEIIDMYEFNCKRGYNTYSLIKNSLDFEVDVFTDGHVITLRLGGPRVSYGVVEPIYMRVYPHPKDGYIWESFADKLVSFIHSEMYRSGDVQEVNFDFIMRDDNND